MFNTIQQTTMEVKEIWPYSRVQRGNQSRSRTMKKLDAVGGGNRYVFTVDLSMILRELWFAGSVLTKNHLHFFLFSLWSLRLLILTTSKSESERARAAKRLNGGLGWWFGDLLGCWVSYDGRLWAVNSEGGRREGLCDGGIVVSGFLRGWIAEDEEDDGCWNADEGVFIEGRWKTKGVLVFTDHINDYWNGCRSKRFMRSVGCLWEVTVSGSFLRKKRNIPLFFLFLFFSEPQRGYVWDCLKERLFSQVVLSLRRSPGYLSKERSYAPPFFPR